MGIAVLLLAGLSAACGTTADDEAEVVTDGGGQQAPTNAALERAARASFEVTDTTTDRTTPDGVVLGVEAQYFEPLVVEGWAAPDECAFNTSIEVDVDDVTWPTVPFDGPSGPTDDRSTGFVGGVVPVTDPSTGEAAQLVLVVAYAHRSVVTLERPDGADGAGTALDTQPADGWTPLGLLVPADEVGDEAAGDGPVDVIVTRVDEAGVRTTTELVVPQVADGPLALLTPEWVFDESVVGPQCEPPPGAGEDPLNEPTPPETNPLGGTIGEKPPLPSPGEQPDDPTQATAAVLESIRIVYDIGDLYEADHAAHLEDPELGARILEEIRAQQVVEPYLGNLDPVFDSVVFTSPTEASVLYRVGPSYAWEIGRVLLVDGTWRVALGTLCRDLADAIYTCPGVTPDPPPSPLGGGGSSGARGGIVVD
jgi:hypothetical protein